MSVGVLMKSLGRDKLSNEGVAFVDQLLSKQVMTSQAALGAPAPVGVGCKGTTVDGTGPAQLWCEGVCLRLLK